MKLQRGDTIIEVMFAMVVIGFSLSIAFGIANKSIQTTQATQERTEAQKIAESQIELLKVKYATDGGFIKALDRDYCLYKTATGTIDSNSTTANNSKCKGVKPLGSGVDYAVSVESLKDGVNVKQFNVTVTWERIGTNSIDPGILKLFYRPGIFSTLPSPVFGSYGSFYSAYLNLYQPNYDSINQYNTNINDNNRLMV